jgi:uncharacterized NAD(P)/FAD-binding protein YdhS
VIIDGALSSGHLRLLRGAFLGASRTHNGTATVNIRTSGSGENTKLDAGIVFDCRGIRRDPARHASPLIAGLFACGAARIDPLNIGLDVDLSSRLISASGKASDRLFAIGPVPGAAFWEITAIPDIRDQTQRPAATLIVC